MEKLEKRFEQIKQSEHVFLPDAEAYKDVYGEPDYVRVSYPDDDSTEAQSLLQKAQELLGLKVEVDEDLSKSWGTPVHWFRNMGQYSTIQGSVIQVDDKFWRVYIENPSEASPVLSGSDSMEAGSRTRGSIQFHRVLPPRASFGMDALTPEQREELQIMASGTYWHNSYTWDRLDGTFEPPKKEGQGEGEDITIPTDTFNGKPSLWEGGGGIGDGHGNALIIADKEGMQKEYVRKFTTGGNINHEQAQFVVELGDHVVYCRKEKRYFGESEVVKVFRVKEFKEGKDGGGKCELELVSTSRDYVDMQRVRHVQDDLDTLLPGLKEAVRACQSKLDKLFSTEPVYCKESEGSVEREKLEEGDTEERQMLFNAYVETQESLGSCDYILYYKDEFTGQHFPLTIVNAGSLGQAIHEGTTEEEIQKQLTQKQVSADTVQAIPVGEFTTWDRQKNDLKPFLQEWLGRVDRITQRIQLAQEAQEKGDEYPVFKSRNIVVRSDRPQGVYRHVSDGDEELYLYPKEQSPVTNNGTSSVGDSSFVYETKMFAGDRTTGRNEEPPANDGLEHRAVNDLGERCDYVGPVVIDGQLFENMAIFKSGLEYPINKEEDLYDLKFNITEIQEHNSINKSHLGGFNKKYQGDGWFLRIPYGEYSEGSEYHKPAKEISSLLDEKGLNEESTLNTINDFLDVIGCARTGVPEKAGGEIMSMNGKQLSSMLNFINNGVLTSDLVAVVYYYGHKKSDTSWYDYFSVEEASSNQYTIHVSKNVPFDFKMPIVKMKAMFRALNKDVRVTFNFGDNAEYWINRGVGK